MREHLELSVLLLLLLRPRREVFPARHEERGTGVEKKAAGSKARIHREESRFIKASRSFFSVIHNELTSPFSNARSRRYLFSSPFFSSFFFRSFLGCVFSILILACCGVRTYFDLCDFLLFFTPDEIRREIVGG